MAVDKMWDVLRFLKSPQSEPPEELPEASKKAKQQIDSRLVEALEALEATEAAVDRVREETPGVTPEESVLLTPPPEASRFPAPPSPAPEESSPSGRMRDIPVGAVRPNPYQPRLHLDEEEIRELAESIREVGVLQPLLVRPLEDGYELVAGERRLRAAKEAGLSTVPALIMEVDPFAQQLLALVENLQRRNLSSIEEGKCLEDLISRTGWSQTELARRLGRSQAAVANKIRLLKLDEEVQELVVSGRLGERQARALLPLPLPQQRALAYRAMEEDLTVRDLERLVDREREERPVSGRGRRAKPSGLPANLGGPEGPTGELLQDLAALVNKHRARGIPAQWKVRELAQNALVVEIIVDLKAHGASKGE